MNTFNKFLISTLILAALSFNLAEAAAPPGKSVTPSISLQGGSTSNLKWTAPANLPYKVHVFVPNTGKVTNALYRVYPKGKRAGNSACSNTDPLYPCFEVTIDQSQHRNAWVQLTLNGDPETQWLFTKTKGYVAAVADNLAPTTLLNVSTQLRFAPPPAIKIGDTYQGGIVFYIDGSGLHGLIAAPNDQTAEGNWIAWWNGSDITTGATATAVGTGQDNTNKIITAQGAGNYAASLADSLDLNGYSDWFLPSRDELNLMYWNIGPGASAPLTDIGNFTGGVYWSSSEYDGDITQYKGVTAWYVFFGDGAPWYQFKENTFSVRAVRAF